jgi:hypothetical protein
MDNQAQLDSMIETYGSLSDIPWTTMYDQSMTLGTMTDEHLDACIEHHQGLIKDLESGRPFGSLAMLEACRFIVFMMLENRKSRLSVHAD